MNAQKCLRWILFQRFYFPRIFVGVAESVQGFPLKPLPSACSFWYLATDYCCQKRHFIFHPIHIATSCLDFHSGRNAAHAEMYFPCTALHRVLFALLIFQAQRQCIFSETALRCVKDGCVTVMVFTWCLPCLGCTFFSFSFSFFLYLRKCTPASPCSLDSFYLPFYLPFFCSYCVVSSFFLSGPLKGTFGSENQHVFLYLMYYTVRWKKVGWDIESGSQISACLFGPPVFSVLRFVSIWNIFFQVATHYVLFLQSIYGRFSVGQVNNRTEKHVEMFWSRSCTLVWSGVPQRKMFLFISDMPYKIFEARWRDTFLHRVGFPFPFVLL